MNKASIIFSLVISYSSCIAKSSPGTTPEDPAVGAATISPIEALHSSTAIAYIIALLSIDPPIFLPCSICSCIFLASPPIRPPIDFIGVFIGIVAESLIISRTLFILFIISSFELVLSSHSLIFIISEIDKLFLSQSSKSSLALLKSIKSPIELS